MVPLVYTSGVWLLACGSGNVANVGDIIVGGAPFMTVLCARTRKNRNMSLILLTEVPSCERAPRVLPVVVGVKAVVPRPLGVAAAAVNMLA